MTWVVETSNKAAEALPDVAAEQIFGFCKSELKAKDYNRAVRLQIQGIIQYLGLSDSQLTQLGVTNSARAEHETAPVGLRKPAGVLFQCLSHSFLILLRHTAVLVSYGDAVAPSAGPVTMILDGFC